MRSACTRLIPDQPGTGIGPRAYHHREGRVYDSRRDRVMIKFLLFCILFVLCWPLALLALIAYPIVWLLLIPFRLIGIAVDGVLELVKAILFLPVRVIRAVA